MGILPIIWRRSLHDGGNFDGRRYDMRNGGGIRAAGR